MKLGRESISEVVDDVWGGNSDASLRCLGVLLYVFRPESDGWTSLIRNGMGSLVSSCG